MHPSSRSTRRRKGVGESTGPRSSDLARPAVDSSARRKPLKDINLCPAPAMNPEAAAVAAIGRASAFAVGGFMTRVARTKDGDGKIPGLAAASPSAARPNVMLTPDCHGATDDTVQRSPCAARGAGEAQLRAILSGDQGGSGNSSSCSSDRDRSEEGEGEDAMPVPLFNLLRRAPARSHAVGAAGGSTAPTAARAVGVAPAGPLVNSGVAAAGSCLGVARLAADVLHVSPEDFVSRRRSEVHHSCGGMTAADSSPVSRTRQMAGEVLPPPQLHQNRRAEDVCHALYFVSDATTAGVKQSRQTPPAAKPAPGAHCGSGNAAAATLATAPGGAAPTADRLRLGSSGRRVSSSPFAATTPAMAAAEATIASVAGAAAVTGTSNSGPRTSTDEMLARAIQTAQRRRRSTPAPLRSLFEEDEEDYKERPGRDCIAQDHNHGALLSPRKALAGSGPSGGGGVGGCLLGNGVAHVEDPEGLTAEPPAGQGRQIVCRRWSEGFISTPAKGDTEAVAAAVRDLPPVDESPDDAFLCDDHETPGQGWEQAPDTGWRHRLEQQQQQVDGQPPGHQQQQGSHWRATLAAPAPLPHKPPPEVNQRPRLPGPPPLLPLQPPESLPQQQQPIGCHGGAEPPQALPQQLSTQAGSGRHGQAAGPATKRRATAATKAAAGTQSIVSFLLRQPQAVQAAAPASVAISSVDGAPQKRPQLRLSVPDPGLAVAARPTSAAGAGVGVSVGAGPHALKPITIDLADGDASQPRRRMIHGSEMRAPIGPAPVIVVLDEDEGNTGPASTEGGGLHVTTGSTDAEAAMLEDEDELSVRGNVSRVRRPKRRHAVLLLDNEDEEEGEEIEGHGGAAAATMAAMAAEPQRPLQGGLHLQASGACAKKAPRVQPVAAAGAMSGGEPYGHPLLRLPHRDEEDEGDIIEECSQDDEEMLGLLSARNNARGNGHGGSGVGTAMACGHPAGGRRSLGELVGGAGCGGGVAEAARRRSLPAGGHPMRRVPGHQLAGAAPQAHGSPGVPTGQIFQGHAAGLPRPQQGLPLQLSVGPAVGQSVPQHQHHHHQPQQQQQTYQSPGRSYNYQHQQDQEHQQQQQQQAAPWWTLLPDFVPAVALAGGYDPRSTQRPEPVFVLYQKQFNGPANSSVAPMHRNTWQHAPPGSGNGAALGGIGNGGDVGSTGGAQGASLSVGGGADNEVMDWVRDLRSGKSRGGGGSRSRRTAAAAGPAGGGAADTGGTSGASGRWYTNNYGVKVSSRGG
ncbi:hypothetical protein Vretifemale_2677 [Volvox reticuliferus]|uniref:Uncharacterized protein n=1 Tax=Volvox reticuliferus TaxID=1737510 RepID=A0A8J4FHH7_9CHLO|nr:hypothetical protein Vretifemale_2677 [Volvox reticuliferus]